MRHPLLLLCLVLSGFTGLSYELLWVRLLSLSFGSTTQSFSTVLAVFFGGLALGAWFAGRNLHRVRKPILTYGMIELATGVAGILLYPLLSRLGPFFATFDPGPGLTGALLRLVVAAPLLLVPTVLMGATLPIVSQAIVARDDRIGEGTSLIYGLNTVGAFLGAYLITYHMLHAFGVWGSVLFTAGVNLLVFALAFLEHRRTPDAPASSTEAPTEASPETAASDSHVKIVQVASFLTFVSGLSFVCFEIVWARLFSQFLGGTIFGIGAVLICFLIGIALGSIAVARFSDRISAGAVFVYLQIVAAMGVCGLTWALPRIQYEILQFTDRAALASLIPQHLQLLVVFLSLLIPTAASGAAFPLLVRVVTQHASETGRRLGSLYAANTVGSILGSVLTGFVLISEVGSEATLYFGLLSICLMAAIGGLFLMHDRSMVTRLVSILTAFVALSIFPGLDLTKFLPGPSTDLSYARYDAARAATTRQLIAFAEGRVANVAVSRTRQDGKQRGLTLNGLGQGAVDLRPPRYPLESDLVGFIPFVHVNAPERGLVVGWGAGGTVDVLLQLGLPALTVVELEEKVLELAPAVFQSENTPLDNPRLNVEINDARHFLLVNRSRKNQGFDLITSMPAHPWVAPALFTREFFELARDNLSDKGVFSTWFGFGTMDASTTESLLRAFVGSFDNYIIYLVPEAQAYYLVGSKRPLVIDVERIEKLSKHEVFRGLQQLEDPLLFPSWVYAVGRKDTPLDSTGLVNTDDSAYVEVHSPRSSTTSPVVSDLLPVEYLAPWAVKGTGPDLYPSLLEHALGTPNGEIPSRPPVKQLRSAKRLVAGIGESELSSGARKYFEGRIAGLEGHRAEAEALLTEAAATAEEPFRSRAEKFRVLLLSKKPDILALASKTHDPDLLVAALDLDFDAALAMAKDQSVQTSTASELAWLIKELVTANPTEPGDETGQLDRLIQKYLVGSQRAGLSRLCGYYARAVKQDALTTVCEGQLARSLAARASKLLREGQAAGARARFPEAAEKLQDAFHFTPTNPSLVGLLLIACLEAPGHCDFDGVVAQARMFINPDLLGALVDEARQGKASGSGKGAFSTAKDTESSEDMSATGAPDSPTPQ